MWYKKLFILFNFLIEFSIFKVKKATNLATCSPSILCDNTIGLSCQGSTCNCTSSSLWNGTSCQTGYFGATCTSTSQCWVSHGLICINGVCACTNSSKYGWDGIDCSNNIS